MDIVNQLKSYNFTNFKLWRNDPQGKTIAEVMEVVPRGSKTHIELKKKIDDEIGFDRKKQRGMPYPTLIKYLALALDDMRVN